MKLLQINTWTLRLSFNLSDMIINEAPDIVAFQEIADSKIQIGLFPSLTEFMDRVKFHHTYFSPVYSFLYMSGSIEFGNAIISNLELLDQNTVFTNLKYKDNFSLQDDDYNVRNFQHVTAKDENGNKFHLINHHGYHVPEHKKGDQFTLKACEQIAKYANSLDGPVIISGDFNLEPGSESLAAIEKSFRNLSTEYKLKTTRNSLTKKTEVCDYIFVNESVHVTDFYLSKVVASDHQGLVLDFTLS
ncbi:MAG: endonuclease/exonuclease/phosphatase family protein [Candidatus Saccharimonadales bacterium]